MSPLVYIVRHGQTDWNAEFRLQGQADTDLNELGRRQAAMNGRALARLIPRPEEFDFVASPMRRTCETMERLRAAMGLDPTAYATVTFTFAKAGEVALPVMAVQPVGIYAGLGPITS